MSDFFKILKADPLGEPYTPSQPGASAIQSYWCQVEGQDKAVMIGKQVGNTLTPGQHVYGDLLYAKSQKGNEYWKFKSQKVPDGVQRPADSPAQAQAQAAVGTSPVDMSGTVPGWFQPFGTMIEYIYKEMKQVPEVDNSPLPVATVHEETAELPVAGEPLSEDTKALLDDIFGKPDSESPSEPFEDK